VAKALLENALMAEEHTDGEPSRKSPAKKNKGKKKDEKKQLPLLSSVQSFVPALQHLQHTPSQWSTNQTPTRGMGPVTQFDAPGPMARTAETPHYDASLGRSPGGFERTPVNGQASWQPQPYEDRFCESNFDRGMSPSAYPNPNPAMRYGQGEEQCYLDHGAIGHPAPTGPPPPTNGYRRNDAWDPQWQGQEQWQGWDESGMSTPASQYSASGDGWSPHESAQGWQHHGHQGTPAGSMGEHGQAFGQARRARPLTTKRMKPEKSQEQRQQDERSPSVRTAGTPSRSQYSGMQFSYAVSAAPANGNTTPANVVKKPPTPAKTARDAKPHKQDLFAAVCRLMVEGNLEEQLRAYEHMPYED
jgi:hypothetical protein